MIDTSETLRHAVGFDIWFERQVENGALGLHGIGPNEINWMQPIMRTTYNAGRESGYNAGEAHRIFAECVQIADKHYLAAHLAYEQHGIEGGKHGAIAAKAIAHEIDQIAQLSLLAKEGSGPQ